MDKFIKCHNTVNIQIYINTRYIQKFTPARGVQPDNRASEILMHGVTGTYRIPVQETCEELIALIQGKEFY